MGGGAGKGGSATGNVWGDITLAVATELVGYVAVYGTEVLIDTITPKSKSPKTPEAPSVPATSQVSSQGKGQNELLSQWQRQRAAALQSGGGMGNVGQSSGKTMLGV